MRLASNDIVIELSPATTVTLNPSLRAAVRLDRKYQGFQNLFSLILNNNVSAISDVIREGTGECVYTRYLDCLDGMPLIGIDRFKAPCLEFILALTGNDDDDAPKSAKSVTFEQHFTDLYRIATGWLGWTPDDAWSATPAEIIEAYKGRAAMLAAIFGGGEKETPLDLAKMEATERRAQLKRLAAIGDLTNHVMP